jgi:hypothetical protein
MFHNLQPLDKNRHQQLKYKAVNDFSFAAQTVSAPLVAAEIARAARCYPVVFTMSQGQDGNARELQPLAVFSLVTGSNPFVGKKGEWLAPYIPAHVRRYPFALAPVGKAAKYALMIDLDAPQLKKRGGEPLFDEQGQAAPVLEQAQKFLRQHQREVVQTEQLMTELAKADVLVPYQLTVGNREKPRAIRGFRIVDMKKVAALDDATLAAWVRNGLMAIVMAHLQSMANVGQLARMQPELTAPTS